MKTFRSSLAMSVQFQRGICVFLCVPGLVPYWILMRCPFCGVGPLLWAVGWGSQHTQLPCSTTLFVIDFSSTSTLFFTLVRPLFDRLFDVLVRPCSTACSTSLFEVARGLPKVSIPLRRYLVRSLVRVGSFCRRTLFTACSELF